MELKKLKFYTPEEALTIIQQDEGLLEEYTVIQPLYGSELLACDFECGSIAAVEDEPTRIKIQWFMSDHCTCIGTSAASLEEALVWVKEISDASGDILPVFGEIDTISVGEQV